MNGYYWQYYVRWLYGVMIDSIISRLTSAFATDGITGIGINVKAWKIRARDVESDAVTAYKEVRRWVENDRDLRRFTRW